MTCTIQYGIGTVERYLTEEYCIIFENHVLTYLTDSIYYVCNYYDSTVLE